MPKSQTLTPTEKRIAIWIARGKSHATIAAELSISPGTLRVHMSHIRAKTGIISLEPDKLAAKLERMPDMEKDEIKLNLSPAQESVLRLISQGQTYQQITDALDISIGTAMNHASQGCKRLHITSQGHARRDALRAHFRPKLAADDWRNDPMFGGGL